MAIEQLNTEPLKSAACLLRAAISSYGGTRDDDIVAYEPDDPHTDDVLQVLQSAKAHVNGWLAANFEGAVKGNPGRVFDALDLLTVVEAAMSSGLELSTRQTCNPVRASLQIAEGLLELADTLTTSQGDDETEKVAEVIA